MGLVSGGADAGFSVEYGALHAVFTGLGCFLFVAVLITWMDRRRERRTPTLKGSNRDSW
jgi:hypothetical protein